MKIVVACGGTGGHAFPGLAVAEELVKRGHEVIVWSSGRDVEAGVMARWKGPSFATLARQLSLRNSFSLVRALWRCVREMGRVKPDALLAMGSYSSLPPVIAAKWKGVKVYLHEANTVPGKAVEFLSRFAETVAISFDTTSSYLPGVKTVLTGLPVRADITSGTRFQFVPNDLFYTVFVTGGSQGAHAVNMLMTKALIAFDKEINSRIQRGERLRRLYVIHQTGVKDEAFVRKAYADAHIPSRVHAFERDMAGAFATADVVVARAGASTCFELAACAKPAFFIPLPTALRDHQTRNADQFVLKGAAGEGVQSKLVPRAECQWLLDKYDNPQKLSEMAKNMQALSTLDAAVRVSEVVEQGVQNG
jgi:UDP-N-acetylglucosamine--N-acetylmuramyl-(pentapeptide) pyrophosphoryl-undecaprenol N-acetylglucosamine transferase